MVGMSLTNNFYDRFLAKYSNIKDVREDYTYTVGCVMVYSIYCFGKCRISKYVKLSPYVKVVLSMKTNGLW